MQKSQNNRLVVERSDVRLHIAAAYLGKARLSLSAARDASSEVTNSLKLAAERERVLRFVEQPTVQLQGQSESPTQLHLTA